eukprot:943149-Rhodomonas_salina.1
MDIASVSSHQSETPHHAAFLDSSLPKSWKTDFVSAVINTDAGETWSMFRAKQMVDFADSTSRSSFMSRSSSRNSQVSAAATVNFQHCSSSSSFAQAESATSPPTHFFRRGVSSSCSSAEVLNIDRHPPIRERASSESFSSTYERQHEEEEDTKIRRVSSSSALSFISDSVDGQRLMRFVAGLWLE